MSDEIETNEPQALTPEQVAQLSSLEIDLQEMIDDLQRAVRSGRFCVMIWRWEEGKLPFAHYVNRWFDNDFPAVVTDARKLVQELQRKKLQEKAAGDASGDGEQTNVRRRRRFPPPLRDHPDLIG